MRTVAFAFVILIAFGCIDPIRLAIEDGSGTLVVDGLVTDQSGYYTVNLSRTITFDNSRPLRVYPVPEKGAVVTISDDTGYTETLEEYADGKYATVDLQGEVGRTYQLHIQTADGQTYSSRAEKMAPVAPVDHLEHEFTVYDRMFTNANGSSRVAKLEGFNIYAVANDPVETGNYYRWQVDGIFEYFSVTDFAAIKQCWAPLARLEDRLTIESDQHFNGQTLRKFVCIAPYDRPTMFLVKLRQQSLTQEAYEFWERSGAQQTATGSLFDPPPSPIPGNVRNDNNPDEVVLGYFGASSIFAVDYLMNRFQASGLKAPHPNKVPRAGDCRTHEPDGTNIRPEGF